MSTTTIHSLNDDCLESLFSLFTLLEWITVLRRVCTRWNVLIYQMHTRGFPPLEAAAYEPDPNSEFEISSIGFYNSISQPNEIYLFKRIHFLVSFNFKSKVQSNGSFLSGVLQSFWNIRKENNPLVGCEDVDDEVFNTMIKDKLESIDVLDLISGCNLWPVNKAKKSKLLSTHISQYHESNPKAVQRLNSFNSLLSISLFRNTLFNQSIFYDGDEQQIEQHCSQTISTIVENVERYFRKHFRNCHCTQIDSPNDGPFESLKLYREFASFSELTSTMSKANFAIAREIIPLVHRMRPEGLSDKFENYHNLSIQTCNQMTKLKVSLCMPSSSVAGELLSNCPCLQTLELRFTNLNFKFDQIFWNALLGLSHLGKLRISYANIDLSNLVQVSPVRTLTLEHVQIAIKSTNVEGQRLKVQPNWLLEHF